jgi:hypothetical protein
VQADWAKISITMHRNDGGIVDAELIRPRWWIAQHNIIAGKHLPMNIEELQVHGSALVKSIDDCPEIADGEGSVVTATFKTREVHSIVRAEIIGPDGEIETIEGTPIHPIWSVDRNDWVPLGELTEGATLQAADGIATVLSLAHVTGSLPVYNIEVHNEQVYQVGEFGVLVHNAYSSTSGNNSAAAIGQYMHKIYKLGLADNVNTFKEFFFKGTRRRVDFLDVANGIVYELKPNNPRAIARGIKQAQGYINELQKLYPGVNWQIVIDTY